MSSVSERGKYSSPDGSHKWEYISTGSCAILIVVCGCTLGWGSPTLSKLMAPDSPIRMGPNEASSLIAANSVGFAMASPITLFLVDRIGRKKSLLIASLPVAVCAGLIIAAKEALVLIVARFIGGFGVGLTACIVPTYLGEIASPKLRGAISTLISVMFNSGVLFVYVVIPYITIRMMASICLGICITFLVIFLFVPDSPYYLAVARKFDEAEAALEKLRGKNDVSEELDLIKETVFGKNTLEEPDSKSKPAKANAMKLLFAVNGNRKAFLIVNLFHVVHHFSGFVSFMVYGHIIFQDMGATVSNYVSTTMMAMTQFIFAILTAFIVDRLGRRPLVFVSGVISGTCLTIIGVYFFMLEQLHVDVTSHAMIPYIATFVLTVALNIGFLPLQYVVTSEIFATDVKTLANCLVSVLGGIMGSLGTKYYLLIAKPWGFGHSTPFLAFAIITWSVTAILMWLLPETKGKTLLQIQKDLND